MKSFDLRANLVSVNCGAVDARDILCDDVKPVGNH